MKSNNNKKAYIPQTVYDNVKNKTYIQGWKQNERQIDGFLNGIIKNVKKNRKKENDNSLYREQNIYTNYTAPLGKNFTQYLKKNKFDYKTDEVYGESLKISLKNEIDNIINKQKDIFVMRKKNQYGRKQLSCDELSELEKKMLEKAKEDKDVKKQIKQAEEKYKTEKNIFNEIKQKPKFEIDTTTQHLNDYFFNHGSNNRELIVGNNYKDLLDYALLSHFYQIPNEQFEKLESFYFKSICCYGGYFDNQTSIFDEIQHKLKAIKGEKKPKCFVRLLKKEYSGWLINEQDKGENNTERHFKFLPVNKYVEAGKEEDLPSLDDVYDNPDNYYDYYYVEEDKIYKVSHDFVHNRKQLIDNDLVRKEAILADLSINFKKKNKERLNFNPFIFTTSFNEALRNEIRNKKAKLVDKKEAFPEFYKVVNNTKARENFYSFMENKNGLIK